MPLKRYGTYVSDAEEPPKMQSIGGVGLGSSQSAKAFRRTGTIGGGGGTTDATYAFARGAPLPHTRNARKASGESIPTPGKPETLASRSKPCGPPSSVWQ